MQPTVEDIIEPDLEICDPHHHLWEYPHHRYLHPELLADIDQGHRVTSTVHVECASCYETDGAEALKPVGETHFVVAQAEASRRARPEVDLAAAIVGYADLAQGEQLEEVLDAHIAAGKGRFRGIRHVTAYDADPAIRPSHTHPAPGLMVSDAYVEGCRRLARRGLLLDAWLYHTQLPELLQLARAVPELTIVLDHLGGPLGMGEWQRKREEVFASWVEGIAALAECANLVVKLGGAAMRVNGFGWDERERQPGSAEMAEVYAPWYHHCLKVFGADRCMFESNFPVDAISCSYQVLWNLFKRLAADCSADEKKALFRDTAQRVYGIGSERS